MKKLVTVQWSYTVQIDVPEGVKPESLIECDFTADVAAQEVACGALQNAADNISWKDGVITDVQDVEDEPLTPDEEVELREIVAEQNRRDEKHGLYGGAQDVAN